MAWAAKSITGVLWTFLWLICLFFYFPFVADAGYLPKLVGFVTILLIGFILPRAETKLQYNESMPFLVLIFIASFPSQFISNNPGDGLLALMRWLILLLLVAFCSAQSEAFSFKSFAVKASSLALLILSFWGVFEWIISLEGFELTHKATYQVSTSFGHRNLYVQYLVLLIPFSALGLTWKGHWKTVSLSALLSSIFLIVVLMNRTAWFTCLIYAMCLIVAMSISKRKLVDDHKKLFRTISAFTLSTAVVALLMVDELYTFVHHFETLFDFTKGTSRDRILLAQRSFELFKAHPLFGIGAGMWKIDIMGFSQEGMLTNSAKVFYLRPHNDYLWVFSESGFIAGGAFLALHAFGIFKAMRKWLAERSGWSFAIVLSWLGFSITSLTSFPIERPEYLLFFAMLLSLTFKAHPLKDQRFWRLSMIFLSAVALAILIFRIHGEWNYLKGKQAQAASSWEASEAYMESAQSAFFQVDALSLPLVHHSALAHFQLGQYEKAAQGFQNAIKINAYHPETWNNLGICAAKNSDLDSALQCFYRAVRFTKTYQDAWLNIAIIQYNQGQWRTSFRSFLKADSAQSTTNYQQLGTLLAIDSLTRMLPVIPDRKIMKTLEAFRNTPDWAFSIIQKSAFNDISFHQQAYIDACFFMLKHCEEYEDCDLVDQIIDQYLPGGKADLNLTKE